MALEVNTVPRLAGMRDEGGHDMGVPERRLNPSDEDRQFLDKGKSGRNQELLSSTIHQTGHGRNSSSGSFVGQPWAFDDGLPGDGSRDVSKVNALMDDGSPWEGRSGATLQRRGSVQGVLERLPHLRQLSVMPAIDHHPQHGNHLYRNYPTTPYESDIIDPSFYPRSNPLGPIPGVPQSPHSSNTFSPPFPQPAFTAAHLQPLHQHHMYGPSYTHTFRTAHDLLNQERRAHERTIIAYDALRAQLTAARDHLEAARHREEAAWEREDALRVDLGVMQMRWKEEQEEREEEEAFAFEMEGNLQELVREKQALREELDRVEKTTRSLTAEHSTLGTRLEECKAAHAREVNKVERELRQAQARYAELADSEEKVRVRLGDVTKEREQAWTEVGDLRVAVEREQKVERETRKKLEQAQEMIKMLQVDLETARKTVEILQKTVKETPSSADPPQLEDVIRERDLAREQLDAQQRAHAAVLADWQKAIQYLCDEDDSSPLGARFVAQKEHLNALTAQLAQNIRSSTDVHAEMHALRARLEHEEARNASMADMANGWHREGRYAAEALNKLREELDAAKKVAIEGGEALRREVAAKAVVQQELVKAQNMLKTLQKARSDGAQDVEVQSQAEAKTEVALTKVVVDALIKERDALMIERDSLHDELDAIRAVEKAVERYSDVSMSPEKTSWDLESAETTSSSAEHAYAAGGYIPLAQRMSTRPQGQDTPAWLLDSDPRRSAPIDHHGPSRTRADTRSISPPRAKLPLEQRLAAHPTKAAQVFRPVAPRSHRFPPSARNDLSPGPTHRYRSRSPVRVPMNGGSRALVDRMHDGGRCHRFEGRAERGGQGRPGPYALPARGRKRVWERR